VTASDPDVRAILEDRAFVDRLAAVEHERWTHWQRYVHDQCQRTDDGSLVIPAELVRRWSAQIETPYPELSEAERESDRDQVRRYLPLIIEALSRDPKA
jgi:hypothetical protein